MIRQVIIPQENSITIDFPDEFIGQSIEILVFRLSESSPLTITTTTLSERLSNLESALSGFRISLKDFKFDRNLANDYE